MKQITVQSALGNPNWEIVITGYEDTDYTVFKEIGMKDKSTLWLHIHDTWTGVFVNEAQFIRTLSSWEQLGVLKDAMFGD
jgi:hypothetical protein